MFQAYLKHPKSKTIGCHSCPYLRFVIRNELVLMWLYNKSEDILANIHKSCDKLQTRKSARLSFWISAIPKVQKKWLPEAAVYVEKLENELVLLWLCDKSEDILVDIHKSRDKLQPRKSARLLWICILITTYFTTATYYMIDRDRSIWQMQPNYAQTSYNNQHSSTFLLFRRVRKMTSWFK